MIYLILGKQGSGKTLTMTKIAYDKYKEKKKIYANYTLKFKYTPFTEDILIYEEELKDAEIFIDEAHAYFDSRHATSIVNKTYSYIFAQARKRHVNFYLSTHNLMFVDLRIRFHTDFFIYVKPAIKKNNTILPVDPSILILNNITPDYIIYSVYDTDILFNPSAPPLIKKAFPTKKYFKLYDTNELILPDWERMKKVAKNVNKNQKKLF